MNRLLQLAALAASLTCAWSQAAPKMLVVLTVDQFRYDYLTKFRKEYNAGLATLLTKGAVYTNANYEHMPTVTAVGHSTIMSGASPALSGIVANEWYDRETGKSVSSVSDPKSKLLGAEGEASSPHRLMVSTVPDEIKMSGKGLSKTIGISIKDRSAILPAGRMADAAYWFSNEAGAFVSSTWYQQELPGWVAAHNARKPGEKYVGKEWAPLAGGAAMRTMPGKPDTMFYSNLERSPFGNELLEEFAEMAVENEKLGTHPGVDVLALSLSCNDYVGHAWGPDSPESHDMAVRTDRLLGKLFAFLDKKVGMKNVLVAFTADHGVAPVPELNIERKMPGGRLKDKEYVAAVENALIAKFGGSKWVVSRGADLLFLDPKQVAANGPAAVRAVAADALRNLPHVFRVYTKEQIAAGQVGADLIGRRVANGHHVGRGPDAVLVTDPYWISGTTGTTHGAPFGYDTHVPLILMGPGVKPGRYGQSAAVNDIAPTVATILEVEVPSGSMGRVLHEALLQ